MRKHLYIIFALPVLIGLITFTGCNKNNIDSKSVVLPVIESYLMPGQPVSVKLYTQKALTDTAVYGPAITGASLYVSDGTQKVHLTETIPGTYTYTDPTFLVTSKTYSLQFSYLGYAISASTVMPAKPTNFASIYQCNYPGDYIAGYTRHRFKQVYVDEPRLIKPCIGV